MPRRCPTDDRLPALLAAQDFVIHRDQAVALGLTAGAITYRLRWEHWQVLLPDVYLTISGEASRRQMLVAALLYAGPESAIDDVDACWYHGVRAATVGTDVVRVVAPHGSAARSRDFVVVRRTTAPIMVSRSERLRYLELGPALIAAGRRLHREPRRVLALLSDAVQRRLITPSDLMTAHIQASPRHAGATDAALEHIIAGVRSATEGGFRGLAEASLVLPPLLYNCLLRLPTGEHISPDALAIDAGLVHETNGRKAHARGDLFEDTMVRHTLMTTSGLVVVHNSGTRVIRQGRLVISQFERCHALHKGRGMPAGVEIVNLGFEGPPPPALRRELERWGYGHLAVF